MSRFILLASRALRACAINIWRSSQSSSCISCEIYALISLNSWYKLIFSFSLLENWCGYAVVPYKDNSYPSYFSFELCSSPPRISSLSTPLIKGCDLKTLVLWFMYWRQALCWWPAQRVTNGRYRSSVRIIAKCCFVFDEIGIGVRDRSLAFHQLQNHEI